MPNINEINCKLVSLAEAERAESLFDLTFSINPAEFFRLKFDKDNLLKTKVCSVIYKFVN